MNMILTVDLNLSVQYALVGVFVAVAICWVVVKIIKRPKNSQGCSGCALSEACNKTEAVKYRKRGQNSVSNNDRNGKPHGKDTDCRQ